MMWSLTAPQNLTGNVLSVAASGLQHSTAALAKAKLAALSALGMQTETRRGPRTQHLQSASTLSWQSGS